MSRKRKYTMIVEKTDTGFSAFEKDLPVFTTGSSIPDLIFNSQEALSLAANQESNIDPKLIKFEIDVRQFFQYYKLINAKSFAIRIGMNPTLLSQYVQGHKKPSSKQTKKILDGIHSIGQELSNINLLYHDGR